jgi:hypothetical protein
VGQRIEQFARRLTGRQDQLELGAIKPLKKAQKNPFRTSGLQTGKCKENRDSRRRLHRIRRDGSLHRMTPRVNETGAFLAKKLPKTPEFWYKTGRNTRPIITAPSHAEASPHHHGS